MARTAGETTGLLSLPLELLERIADLAGGTVLQFSKHSPCYYRTFNENMVPSPLLARRRIQTICTLRLVNKRMHDAASHVLSPILRIQMSEESLLRADRLLRIPQIARGIRSVQVSAAYCHDDAAASLTAFTMLKEGNVLLWKVRCTDAIEDDHIGQPRDKKKLEDVEEALRGLLCACNGLGSDNRMTNPKRQIYREIIQEAFEHFQTQRQEQRRLLSTGLFVTRVASLMTALPGLRSLCIEDTWTTINLSDAQLVQVLHDVSEKELMFAILAEPMSWAEGLLELYDLGIERPVMSAALLCDMPIALHRAGVHLKQLYIRCLPPSTSLRFLQPQNCFLQGTSEELRQALCSLSRFSFASNYQWNRSITLDMENRLHVEDYLTLCTSSEYLHECHLHLGPHLAPFHSIPSGRTDTSFDLRNLLTAVTASQLNKVCISSAIVSRASMASLCQILGSHTTLCSLSNLSVLDAGWEEIVEMILGVIGPQVDNGLCLFENHGNSGVVS